MTLRSSAVSMPELGKLTENPAQQTQRVLLRRYVIKIKLSPGKGLIDRIRLYRSNGKGMTGVSNIRISVTPRMLSEHNRSTAEDFWTAIQGRITAATLMLPKFSFNIFAVGVVYITA